ncbi:peptidyl-prolyl cis-trans isomerase-like 4 isoform X2 [Penaeus vannamei]|uniref:peptidyl-prolyl cis-trans isomerase-like 4 isoform X2 n=1 Tax=Penaeus vannamei TaxID=6689 RepID=UPI00387F3EE1
MSVVIETTIGDITVDLFTEERPRTCLNFLKLCKMKYYNLHLIYSVERNFIAQTGDPSASGHGAATSGEKQPPSDEPVAREWAWHDAPGVCSTTAMACTYMTPGANGLNQLVMSLCILL